MTYVDDKVTLNLDKVEDVSINGRDASTIDIVFTNGKQFSVKYPSEDDASEAYDCIKDGLIKYAIEVQQTIKDGTEIAKIKVNDTLTSIYTPTVELMTKKDIEEMCNMEINYDPEDDGCHCEPMTDSEIEDIII